MSLGFGGNVVGSAVVELDVNSGSFNRDLDRAERKFHQSTSKMERQANVSSGRMGNAFKAGSAVAVASIGAIGIAAGVGLVKAIDSATRLGETINKSNVIWGKNAKEVEKWSTTTLDSLGISQQAALDTAATFGDMFQQIGFGSKEAVTMSKRVVQMTADFASFNDLPTAEVSQMISAAFRGEYDSLQRLIPNINAARVEKEALAETGKKNTKQLTAEEKAQATYNIILKDGARASGDYKRTAESAANQQRKLGEAMKESSARIGDAFLPATQSVLGTVNALIPRLSAWGETLATKLTPKVQAFADFVKRVFSADSMGAGLSTFGQGIQNQLTKINWIRIGEVIAMGIASGIERTADIANSLLDTIEKHPEQIDNMINFIANRLEQASGRLAEVGALLAVRLVATLLDPAFWIKHWDVTLALLISVFPLGRIGALGGKIGAKLLDNFNSTLLNGLRIVAGKFGGWLGDLVTRAANFGGRLASVMKFGLILGAIRGVVDKVGELWDRFVRHMKIKGLELVLNILEPFSHLPSKLGGWARDAKENINNQLEKIKDQNVKVNIQVAFNGKSPATRYKPGAPGGADGLIGHVRSGANAYAQSIPQTEWERMFPEVFAPIAANPGGLQPYILDELGLAQSMGLSLSSGKRAPSRTSTGGWSLHGSGQAIDVTGSPGQMASYARRVAGRPGVAEVIYTPVGGWYPGRGWGGVSGQLAADHYSHVHVGVRGPGDGLVGRVGGFIRGMGRRLGAFMGDGIIGRKSGAKKLISRFNKGKTGEAALNKLVGQAEQLEQNRSNIEREYSQKQRAYSIDDSDSIIKTRTVIDEATGESYEEEYVDEKAKQREGEQIQDLIGIQAKMQDITNQIQTKVQEIIAKVKTVTAELNKAFGKAGKGLGFAKKRRGQANAAVTRIENQIKGYENSIETEGKKKKPDKDRLSILKNKINAAKGKLAQAKYDSNFFEGEVGLYEGAQGDFGSRRGEVSGIGETYDQQKLIDLGFEAEDIRLTIAELEKEKSGIWGAAAAPPNRPTAPTPDQPDQPQTPGGLTPEEVAAQIGAAGSIRKGFLADFSNIFSPARGGGLLLGSSPLSGSGPTGSFQGAPPSVTVVQNYQKVPEDPFMPLRRAQYVAESVFA